MSHANSSTMLGFASKAEEKHLLARRTEVPASSGGTQRRRLLEQTTPTFLSCSTHV